MSSARSFGRCRDPVQTEPKWVVGFLGPLDDLLQLVEDVAVQVAEQYPVDVQRVVAGEPGAGEQGEDVFQWPPHSRGPLPERGAQRAGNQQRQHVRVGQGQLAKGWAVRSWAVQFGSVLSTYSCASTSSATPSSTAALLGTWR